MDRYLRFVFITGVSRFACTSMSSGFNNLSEISLVKEYVGICDVSTQDLDIYFSEHIAYLSSLPELKRVGDIRSEMLKWYDGYSWDGETRLLNPFSLLSCIVLPLMNIGINNHFFQGKLINHVYSLKYLVGKFSPIATPARKLRRTSSMPWAVKSRYENV